jgi:RNA polymerase sigma factor (sigma-70 family)
MDRSESPRAEAWLRQIFEEYGQWLRQSIARLSAKGWGVQPEDIEQEVRVRLWRVLESEKPVQNWPSHLYRMAANATIDALRQALARREEPLHVENAGEAAPEAQIRSADLPADAAAAGRELLGKVQRAMGRLSESRAQAVSLHLRGFTLEEVAALVGWSVPRARNLVYRGLASCGPVVSGWLRELRKRRLRVMSELSLQERYAPQNACFGCGPANPKGLRIRSFEQGAEVVADWTPEPHHEAFAGVLNGGIIGALLDCHSNWAATVHLMRKSGADSPPCTVTADYAVKLLRPAPSGGPVKLRAWVVESSEDRAVVEAVLEAGGKTCAKCRGTFVAVKPGHPAYHRW